MKSITCDRCTAPAEPYQDPAAEAVRWNPVEVAVARSRGDVIDYKDLCGKCVYEFYNLFMKGNVAP